MKNNKEKTPKMPKIFEKPAPPPVKSAFNPVLRERDMLRQAAEDGCYKASEFQKEESNDQKI